MPSDAPTQCPNCFADPWEADPCPRCGLTPDAPRPANALPLGTELHGQFIIGQVLGKPGGFGITYLALDRDLRARVAIKEYLPRDFATRATDRATVVPNTEEESELFRIGLEQFMAEAQTLAQMDHPNIVRVRGLFRANGSAYLVMDYYQGMTLAEYLHRQPEDRMPEDKAIALLQPVLDGLRAVHAKGFLHRDIKPSNVYLARTDAGGARPILLDFGAARQVLAERSRSMTEVLTPGYAPFEQYHRKGKQGTWTDVYAAAAVLYRMLTGEAPPEATARMEEDDLRSAAALGFSPRTSRALDGALALKAAERTQDIATFQQDLQRDAEGRQRTPERTEEMDFDVATALLRGAQRQLGRIPADESKASLSPPAKEDTRPFAPRKRRLGFLRKLPLLLITPITFLFSFAVALIVYEALDGIGLDYDLRGHASGAITAALVLFILWLLLRKARVTCDQITYSGFFGALALSNWFTIPLIGLTGMLLGATYEYHLAALNFLPWLFWQSGLAGSTWEDLQLSWAMAIGLMIWFQSGLAMCARREAKSVFLLGYLVNLLINLGLAIMAFIGAFRFIDGYSTDELDLWANFLCFVLFGGASAFLIGRIWTYPVPIESTDSKQAE